MAKISSRPEGLPNRYGMTVPELYENSFAATVSYY
jgi:hypothetical protein